MIDDTPPASPGRSPLVTCSPLVRLAVAALAVTIVPHAAAAQDAPPPPPPPDTPGAAYMQFYRGLFSDSPPFVFPDGERFWYMTGAPDDIVMHAVDPSAGTVQPLFDIERMRSALEEAGASALPPRGLPFQAFTWIDDDPDRVLVAAGSTSYEVDLTAYTASPASEAIVAVSQNGVPRVVRPGLFLHSRPIFEVPSPDGRWMAGTRDGDVWLRSTESPDSVRLTSDGTAEYGWDVEGARWSSDGGRLAVLKLDRREVPEIPLVRWTAPGSPVETRPYVRAGEPLALPELHIIDVAGKSSVRVDLGGGDAPYVHVVGWHPEGRELYVLRASRLMDRLDLLAVDPPTGASRVILGEESETFLWGLPLLQGYADRLAEMNLFVPLADGDRFLWTSERSGLARLYLYRTDGERLRELTPDSLALDRLHAVDEERGLAYFTASDPRADDPYELTLYRTALESGAIEELVVLPQVADMVLTRSGEFFTLLRGGVIEPPTLELRQADGALVETLWTADIGALERLGWTPPERFTATAADGRTEINGMIFHPTAFDSAGSYPVLEHIYAGPHTLHTPLAMWDRFLWINQAMAEQGFVVVSIDGRGTPGRGKAFQDEVFGRFGQYEIDDHVGALREAAATRPWMDLGRVGIWGHSWGGYFALRALLTHPEFYDVGIASAPAVDLADFRVSVEAYVGCLPATCPDTYAAGANTALAGNLEGQLLLIHGTHDDDVPFGETMRMADALIRAGKLFDMIVFPEATHTSFLGPYYQDIVRRYLVERLLK